MANPPTKTPSLLLEAIKFASSISADTPYEELTKTAIDGGWAWHLRQHEIMPLGPVIAVNFDVLLGKTDGELQAVDTISVVVDAGPGPLSSAARNLAQASLIHLFFGRLPPRPAPVDAPRNIYEDGMEDETRSGRHDDPEPASDIALVERRTPDGLPIFVDLYALGEPGPVVTDAVLNEIEAALPGVTTVPALMALWQQNAEAFQYVQDLGNPEQRAELKRMLDRRKGELEAVASDVAPRRRSAAQVVN